MGVHSDSVRREAGTEATAVGVCYVNYGVAFTVLAPVHVTGDGSHPLFTEVTRRRRAPRWNFYKYAIDADGVVRAAFPSTMAPDDPELTRKLDDLSRSW